MKTIFCKNNFDQIVNIPKEKFIFRPSVYGIILNKNKIVVLRNKSNNKIWFPGGGIEIYERLEEALKREIHEETGLDVEIKELLLTKENFFYYKSTNDVYPNSAFHAFLFFYLCYPKGDISKFNPTDLTEESIDPKWINISEIKKEEISDLSEDLFKLLQNLNKK